MPILMSGGIDSYLAWVLYAPKEPWVFVDLGQKYAGKEWTAVTTLVNHHDIPLHRVELGRLGRFELNNGIIPFRNAHLALAAAHFGDRIIFGVLKDEINSDKSPEFFDAIKQVMDISHRKQYWTEGRTFTVESPIRHLTKSQLIKEYLDKGHSTVPLLKTVSCYSPTDLPCARCPSCFKRHVAFINNDLPLPNYDQDRNPWDYGEASGAVRKAREGLYPSDRSAEILEAMQHAGIS